MKSKLPFLLLFLSIYGVVAFAKTPSMQPQILTLPGMRGRVELSSGDVWFVTSKGKRALNLARYHPWKISWAHVAGKRQLAVGVYKKTKFIPQPHNTLFLYDWDGETITPRWLGSRLSKPFTDFIFVDMRKSGETELISVEKLADGNFCMVIYRWTGFGFQGEWQSKGYKKIAGLQQSGRNITAQTVSKNKQQKQVTIGWLGKAYGEKLSQGAEK